jgi:hypothetical protein
VQLKNILMEKCCRKFTKGVLFLHNNVLAYWALATQKLAYMGFQCLDHLPYYLDRATLYYQLFPALKKQLKDCHFSFDMGVIVAAETWLDRPHSEFFFVWLAKVGATG